MMRILTVLFLLAASIGRADQNSPKLSAALEEAMRSSPRIEAAEETLKALKSSRIGVLLNMGSLNWMKQNAYGSIQVDDLTLPGDSSLRNSGITFSFAPAALFAYKKLGSTVKAQEFALKSVQQALALELVKIWMDFYTLSNTAIGIKGVLTQLDETAAKLTKNTNSMEQSDAQQLSVFKSKLEIQLATVTQNAELAKIDYRRVMGRDPEGVPSEDVNSDLDDDQTIEKKLQIAKVQLDEIFQLPDFRSALERTLQNNPQILAAQQMRQSAKTDLSAARWGALAPNLVITKGSTDIGGASLTGLSGARQSQTSVALSWTVTPGQVTTQKSKAHEAKAALFNETAAKREATASIERVYVQLPALNRMWEQQVKVFLNSVKGLQDSNPTGKIAESIILLENMLNAWAGPTGFNSLTTSIILTKASAHAQMGTLFDQIDELRDLENRFANQ